MSDSRSSLPPLGTLLESIFRDAPEHFVVLAPDLTVSVAGETFRRANALAGEAKPSFLDTVERFSLAKTREVFEALRQGSGEHRALEVIHRRPNGETFGVAYSWVACMDEAGSCRAFVGIGREKVEGEAAGDEGSGDELERLRAELTDAREDMERRANEIVRLRAQLENVSDRDELTGLCNRRHVVDRLRGELDRAQRYDQPITLLLCDIDHMAQVNEDHGQEKGNEVITTISGVIQEQIRISDLASRYDGEEFLVLCPHTDRANAQFLAERLRRRVAELSFTGDGEEFGVTISVGLVALGGSNEFGEEAVLRALEQALDSAKNRGMNRVSLVEV